MKPIKPALTASQKPVAKDSAAAFVLLVILLFVMLPAWKATLALVALFGVALPFVLIERRMVAGYNAGRPIWYWGWVAWALAVVMLAGILALHLHRWGALS